MMDYLLWAPDRDTFLAVMARLKYPGTERSLIECGDQVVFTEIGEIVKVPATYDEQGNELTPAVTVGGHHVNLRATGALAELLTAGLDQMDAEGNRLDLFERTRILEFLGEMDFLPITEEGVPAGWQGTSGVRIYDPASIATPARVWQ